MKIYAKLNDNKSLQTYSTTAIDGYTELTIDAADAHFLGENYNLMWADDNGLVHADNVPATSYERKLAQIEANIDTKSSEIDGKVKDMQDKIDEADDAKTKLENEISVMNTQLDNAQKATMAVQAMIAQTK
ncbi:hypothetical protein [Nicoliella lavandulae]|uniref:Uncharacterized protein n=1 Tax=Nicoliella lavandulae TaxID=3082954 RepID=A0ABU8SMB8_9LACO